MKYRSRKFILSILCLASTVGLAYFGKMNGDVAIVLGAVIASYNYANVKESSGE